MQLMDVFRGRRAYLVQCGRISPVTPAQFVAMPAEALRGAAVVFGRADAERMAAYQRERIPQEN